MKKFITLALALILALSMTVCAFAAETNDGSAPTNVPVTGTYSETVIGEEALTVEVSWDYATWTYTATKTWNTTDLKYDVVGTWANATEGETATEITILNKSAATITATIASTNEHAAVDVALSKTSVELATGASDTLTATVVAAQEDGKDVVIDGLTNGETIAVATVTVTIAKKANLE